MLYVLIYHYFYSAEKRVGDSTWYYSREKDIPSSIVCLLFSPVKSKSANSCSKRARRGWLPLTMVLMGSYSVKTSWKLLTSSSDEKAGTYYGFTFISHFLPF